MGLQFTTNKHVNSLYDPIYGLADSFSIGLWFMATSIPAGDTYFFGSFADKTPPEVADPRVTFYVHGADGFFRCQIRDNVNAACTVAIATNICDGLWHHLALVRDVAGDKLWGYIDGVGASTTDNTTANIDLSGYPMYIGTRNNLGSPSSLTITRSIDDVCIWSAALTAAEIGSLAASRRRLAPTIRGASLVRWWPLQGEHGAAATGANSVSERMTGVGATPVNSPLYQGSVLAWADEIAEWEIAHAVFLHPDPVDMLAVVSSPGVRMDLSPAAVDVAVATQTPGVGLTLSVNPVDIAAAVQAAVPVILIAPSPIDVQVLAEAVGVSINLHPDAINLDADTHWPTMIPYPRAIVITLKGART